MTDPLITIGLPTYNNEKTILNAIRSVFAQTYTNWELIIINDGSSDNTWELIKNISDPRVTLLNDGINKGLISRLNQIVQLSKGCYIARMDGDDLMHPDRIIRQMKYLQDKPELDVIDTGIVSINENLDPQGVRNIHDVPSSHQQVVSACQFVHPSVMGKRNWFLKNPYSADYHRAEDFELWCRTFPDSGFGRIKEPLHFLREGNVSISNYLKTSVTVRKIYKRYGNEVLGRVNTLKLIFQSRLKALTYYVFGLLHIQNILSASRNARLSENEKQQYTAILKHINAVKIPVHQQ